MSRRAVMGLAGLGLVAGLAGSYWYGGELLARPDPVRTAPPSPPVPVVTRLVERRAMPVELSALGTVLPVATVSLRPRVDSVVEEVLFTEGEEVRRGQLLFRLDARPAETQLRQAQANLERDSAQLGKARSDVARYAELLRTNAVARQQYDTAVAQASVLEATVKADAAAVDAARLTLSYTRIEAPIDGRTGAVLVKPGNQVRAADSGPLVNLTQLRPIQVGFNLAERDLPAVRAALAGPAPAGAGPAGAGTVWVQATVPGDPAGPVRGRLDFLDNVVDSGTGTVLLKATFDNQDTRLWPGQFARVVVTLRVDPGLLVVPDEALQVGQNGPYAFVVGPDHLVVVRPVTLLRTVGGLSAIGAGLSEGERVVVDGQSRLIPGSIVVDKSDGDGDGGREGRGSDGRAAGGPS